MFVVCRLRFGASAVLVCLFIPCGAMVNRWGAPLKAGRGASVLSIFRNQPEMIGIPTHQEPCCESALFCKSPGWMLFGVQVLMSRAKCPSPLSVSLCLCHAHSRGGGQCPRARCLVHRLARSDCAVTGLAAAAPFFTCGSSKCRSSGCQLISDCALKRAPSSRLLQSSLAVASFNPR